MGKKRNVAENYPMTLPFAGQCEPEAEMAQLNAARHGRLQELVID
jgi:hypothetical protein